MWSQFLQAMQILLTTPNWTVFVFCSQFLMSISHNNEYLTYPMSLCNGRVIPRCTEIARHKHIIWAPFLKHYALQWQGLHNFATRITHIWTFRCSDVDAIRFRNIQVNLKLCTIMSHRFGSCNSKKKTFTLSFDFFCCFLEHFLLIM